MGYMFGAVPLHSAALAHQSRVRLFWQQPCCSNCCTPGAGESPALFVGKGLVGCDVWAWASRRGSHASHPLYACHSTPCHSLSGAWCWGSHDSAGCLLLWCVDCCGLSIHAVSLCVCGRCRLICAPEPQTTARPGSTTCCLLGSNSACVWRCRGGSVAGVVFLVRVLVRSSAVSALAAVRSHLFAALQPCPCLRPVLVPHILAPYQPQRQVCLHLCVLAAPALPPVLLRIAPGRAENCAWSWVGCCVLFLRARQCAQGLHQSSWWSCTCTPLGCELFVLLGVVRVRCPLPQGVVVVVGPWLLCGLLVGRGGKVSRAVLFLGQWVGFWAGVWVWLASSACNLVVVHTRVRRAWPAWGVKLVWSRHCSDLACRLCMAVHAHTQVLHLLRPSSVFGLSTARCLVCMGAGLY